MHFGSDIGVVMFSTHGKDDASEAVDDTQCNDANNASENTCAENCPNEFDEWLALLDM